MKAANPGAGRFLLRYRFPSNPPPVWSIALKPRCDLHDHVYNLFMKNVQITVDEETLADVDRIAKPLGLKRSEIVRQALRDWLRRRAVEGFERDWIAAIEKRPDDAERAEAWVSVQAWGRK
jgi:Arc/MetJ family transcription regulator